MDKSHKLTEYTKKRIKVTNTEYKYLWKFSHFHWVIVNSIDPGLA